MFENFQSINAILPLLTRYRGTGRIHAVYQEEYLVSQVIELEGFRAVVDFGEFPRNGDFRHRNYAGTKRGRGLIIQTDVNELFICGAAFSVKIRQKPNISRPSIPQREYQEEHFMDYLAVEEGAFNKNEEWITTRIRNGDQTDFGIYIYPDQGAVRVVLDSYSMSND